MKFLRGEHLSVDFQNRESKLVVLGTRDLEDPYYKWKKWEKINKTVDFPIILEELCGNYEWINCEFIGNKLIEVHFRRNPDFMYENTVAIPIWQEDEMVNNSEYRFVKSEDYRRKGFLVK